MSYFFRDTDEKLGKGRKKGLRKFKVLQDINQPVMAKLLNIYLHVNFSSCS